jgi:outer membrane protein assembly factor BamB
MSARRFKFRTLAAGPVRVLTLASLPVWLCSPSGPVLATDWPQFLGPTRNGVYAGPPLARSWPKEGPRVAWKKEVGQGFAGPIVFAGRLILFHRLGDQETVEACDAGTGKRHWSFAYPTAYQDDFGFDEGPRATPCVDDGRVYTFGAEGVAHCLDAATGRKLWRVETRKEFGAAKGFFGLACSPLVEGDAVLLNIGGRDGAGIVAFDKRSGELLWKTSPHEASYSSPVAATVRGKRRAFFFTRAGLTALDPASGQVWHDFSWRPAMQASVNAAAPLVIDNLVFLSTCYGKGAVLLRLDEQAPATLWASDDALSNHYATSVHRDGFLYGIDGRADPGFQPKPSLRCVEIKTGKVRWSEESFGAGTVTLANGQLLFLTDRGELILAPATPSEFKPTARAQILSFEVRAHPALAGGFLFARGKRQLVCVDLRGQAAKEETQ